MRLLFKQRFFSWFDSYDIYDENGNTVFVVRGQLSWGHRFKIFSARGVCVGVVRQRIFAFLPKFEIYRGDGETYIGCISKEFTLFKPRYNIDFNGWHVEGNFLEWDYEIFSHTGASVAVITKEIFNFTDTYSIDVKNPNDALDALMLVLAIDAEKCSRDN
ncbi:MAG: LURP-one-related family protein [Clostridia bacterium]|nr:LURP-one-related family protein [Clostridia bacterium]